MNVEFLYNLSLAAGLFVGLMIMMLRFRAADRAATAEEARAADWAAAEVATTNISLPAKVGETARGAGKEGR